jgi:lipid II:glycine glycyltransferase (peptidoglycan interpeptide bridge formation enzyme)
MFLATTEQAPASTSTSRYTMREARSATQAEWDGWLARAPGGGHVYQSYAWGEFKRGQRWRPVRLVMERDGEVAGAGQFLVYNTPLVPGTLMYCTKGPWIDWEDPEAVRTFFGGVRTVAARERAHTVKIEPEALEEQTGVKSLLLELGFHRARSDLNYKTTMILDLSRSEEEILAAMHHKHRYNIRLAARKGVSIVHDNSDEARADFWRLMEITAERDGFRLRDQEYDRGRWEAMRDAGQAQLFLAEHEGNRLAGMVIYTFGRKYWYRTGASSNEKRNLMPVHLLQWEVMRWAKSQGITYYDMVHVPRSARLNQDHPQHGLYRFKAGFGGEVVEHLGCLDLPTRRFRSRLWDLVEPIYGKLHKQITGVIFY